VKTFCHFCYHYLLASSTVAFACGICLAYLSGANPHLLTAAWLILPPLTALLIVSSYCKSKIAILLSTLGLTCLLGFSHCLRHLQLPTSEIPILGQAQGECEAVLTGDIVSMPRFNGEYSRALMQLKTLRSAQDKAPHLTTNTIILSLRGEWPKLVMPGDSIMVRATVRRPTGIKTPGVFSYESYLAKQGVFLQGFVQSTLHIHKLPASDQPFFSPRISAERSRTSFGRFLDKALKQEHAGFYRALLLGDKSNLSQEILDIFQKCGTSHILAISGLHLSILTGLLYFLFRWLVSHSEFLLLNWSARKAALLLALPFLAFYCLVAGANPPVVRALVMSICVVFACCSNRQHHSFSLLAVAALAILIADPLQLFTLSFQLSFVAVCAILSLLPLFRQDNPRESLALHQQVRKWFILATAVSMVTLLVTAPLTLYGFNRFSLVGPLANLLLEPLLCFWALPLGLAALPLHHIAPSLAQILLELGTIAISLGVTISKFLASFAFCELRLPTPSPVEISIYFFGLFLLAAGIRKKKVQLIIPGTIGLLFCTVSYLSTGSQVFKNHKQLTITFIDVGHGSSSLVEMPSGYKILIDGGSSTFRNSGLGEKVLAPFLWHNGIRTVDAVIITHPDSDHYNGIAAILTYFSPKIMWVRDEVGHNTEYRELMALARERDIEVVVPHDGMEIGDRSGYAESLSPQPLIAGYQASNSSIVIRISAGPVSVLFPGDIEAPIEQQLIVSVGNKLSSDILLAPHHGSATSSTDAFLDCVRPQLIVVSAGHSRPELFPSPKLRTQCSLHNRSLFNTAEKGTIKFHFSHNDFFIENYGFVQNNPLLPMGYTTLTEGTFTREISSRVNKDGPQL